MKLYKELTPDEAGPYRQWARANYRPFEEISGLWHPVTQRECVAINEETELTFAQGEGPIYTLKPPI